MIPKWLEFSDVDPALKSHVPDSYYNVLDSDYSQKRQCKYKVIIGIHLLSLSVLLMNLLIPIVAGFFVFPAPGRLTLT